MYQSSFQYFAVLARLHRLVVVVTVALRHCLAFVRGEASFPEPSWS